KKSFSHFIPVPFPSWPGSLFHDRIVPQADGFKITIKMYMVADHGIVQICIVYFTVPLYDAVLDRGVLQHRTGPYRNIGAHGGVLEHHALPYETGSDDMGIVQDHRWVHQVLPFLFQKAQHSLVGLHGDGLVATVHPLVHLPWNK